MGVQIPQGKGAIFRDWAFIFVYNTSGRNAARRTICQWQLRIVMNMILSHSFIFHSLACNRILWRYGRLLRIPRNRRCWLCSRHSLVWQHHGPAVWYEIWVSCCDLHASVGCWVIELRFYVTSDTEPRHFRDVLPSQSPSMVLKKIHLTQQKLLCTNW